MRIGSQHCIRVTGSVQAVAVTQKVHTDRGTQTKMNLPYQTSPEMFPCVCADLAEFMRLHWATCQMRLEGGQGGAGTPHRYAARSADGLLNAVEYDL